MQNIRTKAFRSFFFYLITAGLPTTLMAVLCENSKLALLLYFASMCLAFLLSLLPGHLGSRSIPLRMPLAALLAVGMAALATLGFIANGLFFVRGIFFGILPAVLMLMCVREASLPYPLWTGQHCATIGIVLYAIPSVGLVFASTEDPFLKTALWVLTIVFLAVAGFYLNRQSMLAGLATRNNARPPKTLRRGNRLLIALFSLLTGLIVFWRQLQQGTVAFGKWLLVEIMILINWLANLFGGSKSSGSGGGEGSPAEMLEGLGTSDPAPFWVFLEKVMIVATILLCLLLLFFAGRVVVRLLKRVFARIRDYMKQFAQSASEDYVDEQVDLFDMDDIRERTKERLSKAISRITQRPPRWDQLSTRDKVRYCVKMLYAKAGYSGSELRPLTIREAAPKLPLNGIAQEELTDIYEKARYSTDTPTEQEAEALRKAVKM